MRRVRFVALAALLGAGCRAAEPGAVLYYRTGVLAEAQASALEDAIAAAPFRVRRVSAASLPNGPSRGTVALERGHDSAAELVQFTTWLRQQPGILAAGEDSAVVYH